MNTKLWRLFAVVLALTLFAAACGGDDDDYAVGADTAADADADDTSDDEPADEADEPTDDADSDESDMDEDMAEDEGCTEMHDVVVAQVFGDAPFQIAMEDGYFEANCLNVTLESGLNGSAITQGIIEGNIHFGLVAAPPVALSVTNGAAPIQISAVRSVASAPDNDYIPILISPDADIADVAGFEGARIGVSNPNGLTTLVIKAMMLNAGIDPDSAEYIQGESGGDLRAKLIAGEVDIISVPFPLAGFAIADGATLFGGLTDAWEGPVAVGVTAVSDDFANENPEIVAAFNDAYAAVAAWANEDEERFRDRLVEMGDLAEDARDTTLAELPLDYEPTSYNFDPIFDTLVQLGLVEGDIDRDGVFN